ncbi:2-hydroxychromene-2-carboxylate isomerase [Apiospora kogelbergensis]|uniref:Glutathione S-transferase kappa n=1 Tax=Apiospora kogelbergensis TaxID=1337665 RepID=A0AAW0R2R2_9PEZI
MKTPTIRLYADVVSPFAYLAFHVLRNNDAFRGVKIEYIPIYLPGLMHACGNKTPMAIKNKDRWVDQERLRWARAFNLPMKSSIPPSFPPDTLHTMRALCAISLQPDGQENLVRALDALYAAMWTAHDQVEDPQVFEPILTQVLGEKSTKEALAYSSTVGKSTLKANTDKAFEDGAFGLPWMVCTNSKGQTEGFWGVDRIGEVLRFLSLEKPTGDWKSRL